MDLEVGLFPSRSVTAERNRGKGGKLDMCNTKISFQLALLFHYYYYFMLSFSGVVVDSIIIRNGSSSGSFSNKTFDYQYLQ